ncbi:MAG: RNA polymerase sigma factor [Candidatus Dormibacteraceae bacterium]
MAAEEGSAFAVVLEDLIDPSFALAYALLHHEAEAEDAVQDGLLRAWRKRRQFHDRGSGPRPWVLTIVANECRDRLRSRWWHVRRHADLVVVETGAPVDARAVFRADLERALLRLSREQRAALVLFYQLDLSQEEVAQVLGIKVGTVKSRLNRAVAALRKAMGEEDSDANA